MLDEMRISNVRPGLIVYTCLIQTCICLGSIEKAEELFQRMKYERVKPDAVMFATLIKGQLKEGRFNEALNTALRMIDEQPECNSRHNPYYEVFCKFQ